MQNNRLLYFLAFIKLSIPFILQSSYYEAHRDELLYLAEGNHMAWGYMEVPPLLSVFSWLTNLLGGGLFWVKLWPSLFGACTFLLTGKIILSLGGRFFALLLGFFPFVFGAYLRVHFLFQPNFLEIFFWTLIAYSIIRYLQTAENKWLYLFGISSGLGMLSKYSVAFFIISVLAGLLLTRQRKIFLNKHFYFSAGLAILIFLPNAIWQYANHFPVVHHMKLLEQTQLQYISPGGFIIDQFIMNLPCVFIWLAGLWFVFATGKGKIFRFMGLAFLSVIILLIVLHGKNYYALGAYPVLFAFGAYQLESFTLKHYRVLRWIFVTVPIIIGFLFMPIALPIAIPQKLDQFYKTTGMHKTGLLKWEDLKDHPLPQDFADMLGWKEMAEKVAFAYHTLDSNEQKKTVIFCDNYGQAAAVDYYGKKYHLPQAYSANASFIYWMPRPLPIENLLLVSDDPQEMQHDFIKDFTSAKLMDSIANPYARERGSLIILLKGANESFNRFFTKMIDKKYEEINGSR